MRSRPKHLLLHAVVAPSLPWSFTASVCWFGIFLNPRRKKYPASLAPLVRRAARARGYGFWFHRARQWSSYLLFVIVRLGKFLIPGEQKNIPRALFKLLAAHAPHGLGLVFCHALFTAREY